MMMQQVLNTNKKVIVLCTTLIYELKLNWMFKYIITAIASPETIKKNLITMGFNDSQIDDYINLWQISLLILIVIKNQLNEIQLTL